LGSTLIPRKPRIDIRTGKVWAILQDQYHLADSWGE